MSKEELIADCAHCGKEPSIVRFSEGNICEIYCGHCEGTGHAILLADWNRDNGHEDSVYDNFDYI